MEIEKVKFKKVDCFGNFKELEVIIKTITCYADRGCYLLVSEKGASIDIMNGYGDGTFKAHFVRSNTIGAATDYMWELLKEPNRGIRMLNICSTNGIWWISTEDCCRVSAKVIEENGGMCIGSDWTAYMDWDDHELWIAQSWQNYDYIKVNR